MGLRGFSGIALLTALLGTAGPALAGSSPSPAPHPTVPAPLRAAAAAPAHVSYVGEVQVIRWGSDRATATMERVEHLAPDSTKILFEAPQSIYGDYVVQLADQAYRYDVKHGRVIDAHNPHLANPALIDTDLDLLAANYRLVDGPPDTIAGRPVATVSLINKFTGLRGMRISIDTQTHLILARESFHSDGALESEMRFTAVRITDRIPREIFSNSIPPGFHVVSDGRYGLPSGNIAASLHDAGFAPWGPHYLPEGFALLGADVETVKGVRTLHLLYSDGMRSISLFENPGDALPDFGTLTPVHVTLENHDAAYVKEGPTTLLTWRERSLCFALVGDLEVRDLLQIAASVVP